ncbi:MAG: DUF3768 domain-containing protein [Ferrovibrio sp.]|uniref:DUF3768 domain-containing protein n=1 Tax=Ferrovibrio sp. TaxID=1917215 RepID=UPI00391A67A3
MSDEQQELERVAKIRELNDRFRRTGIGGRFVITGGVRALGPDALTQVLQEVASYDEFTEDNDPYGEHDFGTIYADRVKLFWKIDYYDRTLQAGSEDPADPVVTTRVLTLMRAEEY